MPRFDGTGPRGQGAGTGRGMGSCDIGGRASLSRGGCGFGRRRFFSSKNELIVLEEEKEMLTEELEMIKDELEAIKEEIEALKKEK